MSDINVEKLRGKMAEMGFSGTKLAPMLSMSPKTFYSKMKSGNFTLGEVDKMIDILRISNPGDIFLSPRCLDGKPNMPS